MMKSTTNLAVLASLLAGTTTAIPTLSEWLSLDHAHMDHSSHVAKRATTFCDQWGLLEIGPYTVYNNLWGRDSATSGEQCTTVEDGSGDPIAWSTTWSWAGGNYNVKSYANAVVDTTPTLLADVSSISTTWDWSYTGSDMVANVAYDIFTASVADGTPEYEIMIWLASLGGAGPISTIGAPIATGVQLAGSTWDIYEGSHSQMTVFSFVAPTQITSFSGDLMDFANYLVANHGLDAATQFVNSIGAGTEPFVGSDAVFTTSAYSVSVS